MNKILLLIGIGAVSFVPSVVFGADFVPLTSLPGVDAVTSSDSLPAFFNNLYMITIGIAGVLAVLQIIRGGITYMVSDSGIVEKREAKHHISMAILGLVLVLSPALVFGIINPKILNLQVDVSKLTPQSYEDLPTECRQFANMRAYVAPASDVSQPVCGQGTFLVPRSCCSGLATGATCCGTDGGPGVPPTPGSPAWCVDHPIADGQVLTEGEEGCCMATRNGASYGQVQVGSDGKSTCRIQSASSIRSCTLVGTNDSQATQCTSVSGCEIQGSGVNRICSCKGPGQSAPSCTRTTDAEACTNQAGCFYQDGICGCGGS